MGQRLSVDKYVSNLNELLDMSAFYFEKVKFESKISPDIKQHIKVNSLIPLLLTVLTLLLLAVLDLEILRRQQ